MHSSIKILACILLLSSPLAMASAPAADQPLPVLKIAERGEMVLSGDDISYRPWSGEVAPGTVHVVQYFAGTNAASEIFQPLTDALREAYPDGGYNVTTIVNLDEAMWGTSGLVASTLEKNKRKYPKSTFVLDEDGEGKKFWQLDEQGAGLIIVDPQGTVRYFAQAGLNEQELKSTISLVGTYIASVKQ